jgi:hypothetical protein
MELHKMIDPDKIQFFTLNSVTGHRKIIAQILIRAEIDLSPTDDTPAKEIKEKLTAEIIRKLEGKQKKMRKT